MSQKPIPWEAIFKLPLEGISEVFAHGALKSGKALWRPALEDETPDKTLKQLLVEKRKRIERPRLLHKDSTRGYTHIPSQALPREPEALSEVVLEIYAEENWKRFLGELEEVNSTNGRLYARRRVERKAA